MTDGWNFADLFEALAERQPEAMAQRHAGVTTSWAEFDRRADGVAATLLAAGVVEQDKVAQYLYNSPEYLESAFAAFKAGLAIVNTNYRYAADELVYLWDNADVVAVVFHGVVRRAHRRVCGRACPRIRTVAVGRRRQRAVPGLGDAVRGRPPTTPTDGHVAGPWGRSGDHLVLLYTGGTTGHAEGRDVAPGRPVRRPRLGEPQAPATRARTSARPPAGSPSPARATCPAAPLMHGTGLFNALSNLMVGGSVVTMTGRRFDPVELLDTVETERHQLDVDRRRRVRQADPQGPRRRARPLGHLVAARDRVERRDLVGGHEDRACCATTTG